MLQSYRQWKTNRINEGDGDMTLAKTATQGRAISRETPLYQALGANLAQAFEAIAVDNKFKAKMLLNKITQALGTTEGYQHNPIIAQLKMRVMTQINQLVKMYSAEQVASATNPEQAASATTQM